MLTALRPVFCPSFFSSAGQTATHRAQPVQSSGDTCTVNFLPSNSLPRASRLLKVGGAPESSAGS